MINRIKIFFAILLVAPILVLPAFAAPDIGLKSGGAAQTIAGKGGFTTAGVTDLTLSEQVGKIIKVALSFVGTLFFVLTVYAGFLWMTAAGNEEQVTKSQGILKTAIIGMIITLSAYGVTTYVLTAVITSTSGSTCVGSSC